MGKRKRYIIDTSVFLHDMKSIHAFHGNDVIIPIEVLDELDRFKDRRGLLGESARYINRFLDKIREKGSLNDGVMDENTNIMYKVSLGPISQDVVEALHGIDMSLTDNKILARVHQIHTESIENKTTLVTKDINLRVKCDALGVPAEDYYSDYINLTENDKKYVNSSSVDIISLDDNSVETIYRDGSIDIENLNDSALENLKAIFDQESGRWFPYTLLYASNKSFIGMTDKTGLKIVKLNIGKEHGVEPRGKEQSFALWSLINDDIPLVTMTGAPGSGKTYLSLCVGLESVIKEKYDRIVITRVLQPVGKEIGFLPGDIKEKMDPWLAPLVDNYRNAYRDEMDYFNLMIKKGKIEIAPLAFIRGRSFENCYIIVDEAQNATIHELKTILTRAGEGSKVVLMGDVDQIDTPYIDRISNGLTIVINKFKNSNQASHIHLNRGHRSPLANEASLLL